MTRTLNAGVLEARAEGLATWSQASTCGSINARDDGQDSEMLQATFRQLQTFALAADAGSFAGAAERLGVSPAAVSDQIRALERKLGYVLFERRPGATPLLAQGGLHLLQKTPALLNIAADLSAARPSAALAISTVRVAAGDFVLDHLIKPSLARFQLDHRDIQIEFNRLVPGPGVIKTLQKNEFDLGYFSLRAPIQDARVETLGMARQGLLASPTHPIASTTPKIAHQRLPMIMPISGSATDRMVRRVLAAAGIEDYDVVIRTQDPQTMVQLAAEGAGVCCVFHALARDWLESGDLVDLGLPVPPVYRLAFRRAGFEQREALKSVDLFISSILKAGTSA
ncbi:MAG: LysR family transcriptional regulator [Hyphomonadaceae bacterium]|nr:LysR family transcriptional regulator [Hyphomonadaceae bacterium]